MGTIICSWYKGTPVKRGTLENGVFTRDNVPLLWDVFATLEPDVLKKLEQLRCRKIVLNLRDGRRVETTVENFKSSRTMMIGNPDKRLQHVLNITKIAVNDRQKTMF